MFLCQPDVLLLKSLIYYFKTLESHMAMDVELSTGYGEDISSSIKK